MAYTNLVIDGGGLLGPAYVGALAALGDLAGYTRLMGVSVGSIFAMLLCIGYNIDEIGALIRDTNPKQLINGTLIDLLSIMSSGGRSTNSVLFELVGTYIAPRFNNNPDATFGDVFAKYRKSLVVVATAVTTNTPRYFNHLSDTDMPVRLAIKISCSIPIVFRYVVYENAPYYDGSFCQYDILDYFASRHPGKTLALTIVPPEPRYAMAGIELAICSLASVAVSVRRTHPDVVKIYTHLGLGSFKKCPARIDGEMYNALFQDGFYSVKRHFGAAAASCLAGPPHTV